MLIRTFLHIQSTGLRVSMLDEDSQLPDIATAEQQYIIPAIGKPMYDALNALMDELEGSDPDPDENLLVLLPMVQKPLAAFAYYADLPAIHTRLTSAGLRQTTSDGMPTAYRWQFDQMRTYLEERAYHTLELALSYIYTYEDIYDTWIDPDLKNQRAAQLFKNGNDFSKCFKLTQPYRTFIHLAPVINEVVIKYIEPSLGADFFTEITTATTPDDNTIVLVGLLRLAAANIAISKAVQKLPFKVLPEGFTIINPATGVFTASTEQPAQVKDMGYLQKSTLADGEQYLRRAMKMLQTESSDTQWKTFFDSTLYKGPENYKANTGNCRRKIFRF